MTDKTTNDQNHPAGPEGEAGGDSDYSRRREELAYLVGWLLAWDWLDKRSASGRGESNR